MLSSVSYTITNQSPNQCLKYSYILSFYHHFFSVHHCGLPYSGSAVGNTDTCHCPNYSGEWTRCASVIYNTESYCTDCMPLFVLFIGRMKRAGNWYISSVYKACGWEPIHKRTYECICIIARSSYNQTMSPPPTHIRDHSVHLVIHL